MQEIANVHSTIYETTGGKVRKKKVAMCGCKWKNRKIIDKLTNSAMNKEQIKQIVVNTSAKTLDVQENQSFMQKDEFECAKKYLHYLKYQ